MIIASARDDPNFAAAMTNRQFGALRARLNKVDLLTELKAFALLGKLKKAATFNEAEVRKWVTNGWNTEYLLRSTASFLPEDQLGNAIQWAFPQAYYSAFALTLAYFKTVGHSEQTHAGAIRKFGDLIAAGKYPASLNFLAHGAKPVTFVGVMKAPASSTLSFDANDPASVSTQICQFLSGTRRRDLVERRKTMRFTTKAGKKKKSLSADEWRAVSDSLGYTSLLSLLYRKRIKSNYQEIDTFLSGDIEAPRLFDDLIHVVSCLNLVHEVFIAKAAGVKTLEAMVPTVRATQLEFVEKRLDHVREICAK